MDADGSDENPGSEKNDFITCCTANSMSFMFAQFPFPSQFHGVMQSGLDAVLGVGLYHCWVGLQA